MEKGVVNINDLTNNIDIETDSSIDNQSNADIPTTHEDVIKTNVFVGETPFDMIIEGIEEQFNDYINIKDTTNYVDVFYTQLYRSYEMAKDDRETFQEDMINALDNIYQSFYDKLQKGNT